jgi:hypothetical protein
MEALDKDSYRLYSDTKQFYDMDRDYFNWSARINDAALAIHRILTLKLLPKGVDIAIERGVTDNVFCVPNRKLPGLDSYDYMKIEELVSLESQYIRQYSDCNEIRKVLLLMNDEEFIRNVVLSEPHRKSIYPDYVTYMNKQDEYRDFTIRYNKIDQVTEINDAKEYITKVLGLNYE